MHKNTNNNNNNNKYYIYDYCKSYKAIDCNGDYKNLTVLVFFIA